MLRIAMKQRDRLQYTEKKDKRKKNAFSNNSLCCAKRQSYLRLLQLFLQTNAMLCKNRMPIKSIRHS